ncbi:unnamed protein product [Blepharisma stoltei]|uniref:Leucine-rich repeat-containing protein n=1 Tax=Blepharisma stoltei TaxID=1481888 RepID=A0AAU9I7E0_9CILI|nr:unnamed protein product [Blepharisma stoltei]
MEGDTNEYQLICQKFKINPIADINNAISRRYSTVSISESSINSQHEEHLQAVFHLLKCNLEFFTDLIITGQILTVSLLTKLSTYLSSNFSLKKLVLKSNKFQENHSLSLLSQSLRMNASLMHLDLSNNHITDDYSTFICEIIENNTSISTLILDSNNISNSQIPLALTKNDTISTIGISNNPLSFDFVVSMLEMLTINRALTTIHMSGVAFEGPAPLKENSSGQLTKNEAVILKLAYVLRYSAINYIAIDIDPSCSVQLAELEKTLIKYNRKLTTISCTTIDWTKVRSMSSLSGIHRALRANTWLLQNSHLSIDKQAEPMSDIEDIVTLKQTSSPRKSLTPPERFNRNIDSGGLKEALKKFANSKPNRNSIPSISSSSSSPERHPIEIHEIPYQKVSLGSAETPQFTSSIQGRSFKASGNSRRYDKISEIDTTSSDIEEKRFTPMKPLSNDEQINSLWKVVKSLENGFVQYLENNSKAVDNEALRNKFAEVDSRLEIFEKKIISLEKKDAMWQKRIEVIEENIKYLKENSNLIANQLEQFKSYSKNAENEIPVKLDYGKCEENYYKQSSKISALSSEVAKLKEDMNADEHTQAIRDLKEKVSSLEGKLENCHIDEISKEWNSIRQELVSKYNKLDERQSLSASTLRESLKFSNSGSLKQLHIQDLYPESENQSYSDMTNTPHFTNPAHLVRLEERLVELEKERTKVECVKKQVRDALSKVSAIENVVTKQLNSKRFEDKAQIPEKLKKISPTKEIIPPLDISRTSRRNSIQETERIKTAKARTLTERFDEKGNKVFLPGEAESLVMSAIMGKANNDRLAENLKQQISLSRSISPIPPANSSRYYVEKSGSLPSQQLQETLRKRGINVQSCLTERQRF